MGSKARHLARSGGAIEVLDFLGDSPPPIAAPSLAALASQADGGRDRLLAVIGDGLTIAEIDFQGAGPLLIAPGSEALSVLDPFIFVRLPGPLPASRLAPGLARGGNRTFPRRP